MLTGLLTFSFAIDHADARRMGGGKSFGSFSRSTDRPAASPSQSAQEKAPNKAGSKTRRGGMGGMLGGMLAGGLLAALFFGGAFDELRLMDMLIMAGVAALAFYAFRMTRQNRPAPAGPSHAASGAPYERSNANAETASGSLGNSTMPAWFDKERFLGGAKEHFMTLQRAWDNNDLARIQDYVTPELYNLLREERARHAANNRTDTVRLLAELGSVEENGKTAEATVIFHGLLEENGEQTRFNETWHLTRQLAENAPWYIQGIEQNPDA
ncbi:MAG: Tim44-like domain-containing protein [Halomonas subglaciescola]|nr:Tim44-like domain-containing protein [Halomonas subglaciescola]